MKNPLSPINYTQFIIGIALILLGALVDRNTCAPAIEDEEMEGGCYYMFNHYGEGDRILTNEPCLNCTCHNSMLMCYLRVCPFTKPIGQDCTIEKKPDQCCPVITCPEVPVSLVTPGALISSTTTSTTTLATISPSEVATLERGCEMDGKYYPDGAQVAGDPSKPCELCYCIRNKTACVMQECTLNVDGCSPEFQPGVCCPVRYQCDGPLQITDASTIAGIITTTVSTLFSSTPQPGGCYRGGEYYADGSQIPAPGEAAPCEHCYCMHGEIVCAVQECGSPLENEGGNCTAVPPRSGLCCPEKYTCMSDDGENALNDGVTNSMDSSTVGGISDSEVTQGPNDVSVTVSLESEAKPEYDENTTNQDQPGDSLTMETTSVKSVNTTEESRAGASSTSTPDRESNLQQGQDQEDGISNDGTPSSNEPSVTNQESVTESSPNEILITGDQSTQSSASGSASTESIVGSGSTESAVEATTSRDVSSPEATSSSPVSIESSTSVGSSSAPSESNEDETASSSPTGEHEQAANDGTVSSVGGEEITTTSSLTSSSGRPQSPDNLVSTSSRPQEGVTDSDVSAGINADDKIDNVQTQTTVASNIESQTSTEREPQVSTSKPGSVANENPADSETAGASNDAVHDEATGENETQQGTTTRPETVSSGSITTGTSIIGEEGSANAPGNKPSDAEQTPNFDENSSQSSSGEEVTTIRVAAMSDDPHMETKIKPATVVSDEGSTSAPSQDISSTTRASTLEEIPASTQKPTTGDKDETQVSSESGQIIGEEFPSASPPVINNLEGGRPTTPANQDSENAVSPDEGSDKVFDPAAGSDHVHPGSDAPSHGEASDNLPPGSSADAPSEDNKTVSPAAVDKIEVTTQQTGQNIPSESSNVQDNTVIDEAGSPSSDDSNNIVDSNDAVPVPVTTSSTASPADAPQTTSSSKDQQEMNDGGISDSIDNTRPTQGSSVSDSDSITTASPQTGSSDNQDSKPADASSDDASDSSPTLSPSAENKPMSPIGSSTGNVIEANPTTLSPQMDSTGNEVSPSSTVQETENANNNMDSLSQAPSADENVRPTTIAPGSSSDNIDEDRQKITTIQPSQEGILDHQGGVHDEPSGASSGTTVNPGQISESSEEPNMDGVSSGHHVEMSTVHSVPAHVDSTTVTAIHVDTSVNVRETTLAPMAVAGNEGGSGGVSNDEAGTTPSSSNIGQSQGNENDQEDGAAIQHDDVTTQSVIASSSTQQQLLPEVSTESQVVTEQSSAVHDGGVSAVTVKEPTGDVVTEINSVTESAMSDDNVVSKEPVSESVTDSAQHQPSSTPAPTNIRDPVIETATVTAPSDVEDSASMNENENSKKPESGIDSNTGTESSPLQDGGIASQEPGTATESQSVSGTEPSAQHDDNIIAKEPGTEQSPSQDEISKDPSVETSTESNSVASNSDKEMSSSSPAATESSPGMNDGVSASENEAGSPSVTEINSVTEPSAQNDKISNTGNESGSPTQSSIVTESSSAVHDESSGVTENAVGSPTQSSVVTESSAVHDEAAGITENVSKFPTQSSVVTESSSASHDEAAGVTDNLGDSPTQSSVVPESPSGIPDEATGVTENLTEAGESSPAVHDEAAGVTDNVVGSGYPTQSSVVTESSSTVHDEAAGVTDNVSGTGSSTQSNIVSESSSAVHDDAAGVTDNVSGTGSSTQSNVVTESSSAVHDEAAGVTDNVSGTGSSQSNVVTESSSAVHDEAAGVTDNVSGTGSSQSNVVTESSSAVHDEAAGVTDNVSGTGSSTQSNVVTESSSAVHDEAAGVTDNLAGSGSPTQASVITESPSAAHDETSGVTENVAGSPPQSSVITESSSVVHDEAAGVTDNLAGSGYPTQSSVVTESSSAVHDEAAGVTENDAGSPTQSNVVTESSSAGHDEGARVTDVAGSGSSTQSNVVTESSSAVHDEAAGVTDNLAGSGSPTQSSVVTESSSAVHDEGAGVTDTSAGSGSPTQSSVVTESSSAAHDEAAGVTENAAGSVSPAQSGAVTESSSAVHDEGAGVTDISAGSGSPTPSSVVTESSSAVHDEGASVTDNVSGYPTESNVVNEPSAVSNDDKITGSVTETNVATESSPLNDGSDNNEKETQSSTEANAITESSSALHDGSDAGDKDTNSGITESNSVTESHSQSHDISSTTKPELVSASPTASNSITEASEMADENVTIENDGISRPVTEAAGPVSSLDRESSTGTGVTTESSGLNDASSNGEAQHGSSTESSSVTEASAIMDEPEKIKETSGETVRPSPVSVTTQSSVQGETTVIPADARPNEQATNAPISDSPAISGVHEQPITVLPGSMADEKEIESSSSPASGISDSESQAVHDGVEDNSHTTTPGSISHSSPASSLPEEITESNLVVNEMGPMQSQSLVRDNKTESPILVSSPRPSEISDVSPADGVSSSAPELSSTTAESIDKVFNPVNDSPAGESDPNIDFATTPKGVSSQSVTESVLESSTNVGDKGQRPAVSSEGSVNDENLTTSPITSQNNENQQGGDVSSTQSSNIDVSTAKDVPEVENPTTSQSPASIPSENIHESNDEPALPTTSRPESSTSSAEDDVTPAQDSVEESSVPTITRIPGEGSCFVEGKTYRNGTRIPPSTPCQLACACQNSIVHCLLVHCPPAPHSLLDCKPMYRSGICCPEYDCGSTSSPASITVTPDSGDSSSSDTLVTITPEPFSPETTSVSRETSSEATTIASSNIESEKDSEIHDDDSHKDSVSETNAPVSITIEAIFTSTPTSEVTNENLVSGSTERVQLTSEQPNSTERVTSEQPTHTERVTSEQPHPTDRVTSEQPNPTDRVTSEQPTHTDRVTSEQPNPTDRVTSEQPNPTQGDNQVSMETTSDNILEMGTGAGILKPVTPAEQSDDAQESSFEQTSTSSSSSSSSVSSESSTKPEINEVHPEVSESPEESPSFDPSVEADRRNDTETSSSISDNNDSNLIVSPSTDSTTTTTTTEASSTISTSSLPSSTVENDSEESGAQSVDTGSESSSTTTTTAGSKYPVTTTTSVTPSAAPWPYPTSTQSTVMSSGACLFDGRVYMSAQQIPRDDPCDFCFCFRGDIICLQQSCPPPIPGCYEEPIPGFCCPRYECPVGSGNITTQPPLFPPSYYHNQILNNVAQASGNPISSGNNMATGPGCEISGEYYETGQVITSTSGPCLECRCGSTGMMECDPRECQPEPMLRKMIAAITSR